MEVATEQAETNQEQQQKPTSIKNRGWHQDHSQQNATEPGHPTKRR